MQTPHGRFATLQHYHRRLSTMSRMRQVSYLRLALRLALFRLRFGRGVDFFGDNGFDHKPFALAAQHLNPHEHRRMRAAVTPPEFRFLDENKLAFEKRALEAGIPVCRTEVIITESGHEVLHATAPVCTTGTELTQWMSRCGDGDFVLKRPGGGKGYGIFLVEVRRGLPRAVPGSGINTTGDGLPVPVPDFDSPEGMYRWLEAAPFKPFVWMLQKKAVCHPQLAPLMPGTGLGTVRIQTFLLPDGTVELKWPLLKMPDPKSVTDNFRGGYGGSIIAAIDPERGVLSRGRGRPHDDAPLHEVLKHPVSGATIEGFVMPCWRELLQVAADGARAFRELPALGWDIAVTPDGPLVVEANWAFGLEIIEFAQNRGLAAEMRAAFARVSNGAATRSA